MAEPQTPDQPAAAGEKLFTLSEVSQRSGISMPTLQRYKKTYQDRIPSVGAGRKQRYPEHALPVFAELRRENAGRRGRPRKDASAAASSSTAKRPRRAAKSTRKPGRRPGRPRATARRGAAARAAGAGRRAGAAARRGPGRPRKVRSAAGAVAARRGRRPAAGRRPVGRPPGSGRAGRAARGRAVGRRPVGRPPGSGRSGRRVGRPAGRRAAGSRKTEGLLTLTQISKTTKISYPTLVRYVRLYSNRLPHEGKGRARRFYPEAVDVFRSLRQQSGRGGRRPGRPAGRPAGAGGARRGRPPKAATGRLEAALLPRIRDLERFQQAVEKRFTDLVKGLQKLR